eukprot:CAMPEP_0172161474 /NCGR_PEP_ID=MMETSP1050-20130122/6148_1 /TAXON_ID=233186 /ORGANISM="Cryptomonas curvata, Strain CCAP979/52" /LENGTH=526 /DNA_ID=CAMNT_0012831381 /DNA_START=136 /DNA_END=1718 /DNA_ORIENTATION=-
MLELLAGKHLVGKGRPSRLAPALVEVRGLERQPPEEGDGERHNEEADAQAQHHLDGVHLQHHVRNARLAHATCCCCHRQRIGRAAASSGGGGRRQEVRRLGWYPPEEDDGERGDEEADAQAHHDLDGVHLQLHVRNARPAHAVQVWRAEEVEPLAVKLHRLLRVAQVAVRARDGLVVAFGEQAERPADQQAMQQADCTCPRITLFRVTLLEGGSRNCHAVGSESGYERLVPVIDSAASSPGRRSGDVLGPLSARERVARKHPLLSLGAVGAVGQVCCLDGQPPAEGDEERGNEEADAQAKHHLDGVHLQHHVRNARLAHAVQIRRAEEVEALAVEVHRLLRVAQVAVRARDGLVVAVPRRVAVEALVAERVRLHSRYHHARLPRNGAGQFVGGGSDEARDARVDAEGVGVVEGSERHVDLLPQAIRDAGHGSQAVPRNDVGAREEGVHLALECGGHHVMEAKGVEEVGVVLLEEARGDDGDVDVSPLYVLHLAHVISFVKDHLRRIPIKVNSVPDKKFRPEMKGST